MQIEKRTRLGFMQNVLLWHEWVIDDGELESEDEPVGATNEAWEAEVRVEAQEEFERERDTLIATAQRNITKIAVASPRHIPPSVQEIKEPASTEHEPKDASTIAGHPGLAGSLDNLET